MDVLALKANDVSLFRENWYVVPTGKDNFIVSASRPNMVPAGRTIVSPGRIIFGPGSKDLSRVGSNKWYQSLVALDLGLISSSRGLKSKQVSHKAAGYHIQRIYVFQK
ncbi:hypothetical protein Tco_1236500 [Tanacetum coccineum]